MKNISIIDYGINNLKSVSKAFEKIKKDATIINTPEQVLSAECLVLPGIGAFGDGMDELQKRNLIEPIKQQVAAEVPLLGICLGMQMLFTESEEFGIHKGLNIIEGRVVPFPGPSSVNLKDYKVPHMGWDTLNLPDDTKWSATPLQYIQEGDEVYFVHSYFPILTNHKYILATTTYGNQEFCSVVKKNNIFGTQFHPEKSGQVGLSILRAFCEVNGL